MSNRNGIHRLYTISEHMDEEFLSKRWEDFDHSQKIGLGVWGSTWTIRDRTTSTQYVLQSCHQSQWSLARFKLLQLARQRADLFVTPRFMFFRGHTAYVCSNLAGICLAEVIDSTVAIQEVHVAAIIKQLILALQVVDEKDIFYDVRASNVFISENERGSFTVRLGAFGRKLEPKFRGQKEYPSTGEVLAHLAYHMLTRFPNIPREEEVQPAEQMIVIRTSSMSIPISVEQQLSSTFFDFLEACMDGSFNLESIASVSMNNQLIELENNRCQHMFLRNECDENCMLDLLDHVRRTSVMGHKLELIHTRISTNEGQK